jgi:hypothetical protein
MEYVKMRGSFDDMPLAQIMADFRVVYADWMADMDSMRAADFQAEVERETR